MLGKSTNPLLQKTEQATMAKVPPKYRPAFERIVTAGLKVMYSQQSHSLMADQINKPGDPIANVGDGVGKLMGLLWTEGKGTLPMQAMMPAAVILVCEALDFAEKAGKLQASGDAIAMATKECMSVVLQQFGVTPEKMQQMLAQQQGQQPAAQPAGSPNPPAAPAAPAGIIASKMGA